MVSILFIVGLVGVAAFIFLLTLLQQIINRRISKKACDTSNDHYTSDIEQNEIEEAHIGPIANAIGAYQRDRHAHEHDRAKREKGTIRVLAFTAVVATIAAAAALGSDWFFWGQLDEMRHEGRAWIAPLNAEIDKDRSIPFDTLTILVPYHNSGREPALAFAPNVIPRTIGIRRGFTDWQHWDIGKNKTCDGLKPQYGGPVIFPNATKSIEYITEVVHPINDAAKQWSAMNEGNIILVVEGCFAYNTLNTPHISEFCFFLHPDPRRSLLEWRFAKCATGNYAN
jgi:hypothetical protein